MWSEAECTFNGFWCEPELECCFAQKKSVRQHFFEQIFQNPIELIIAKNPLQQILLKLEKTPHPSEIFLSTPPHFEFSISPSPQNHSLKKTPMMYSLRHAARRTHVTTLTTTRALSSGAPPSLIVQGDDARASLMEEVRQQAYPDLVLTGRQLCDVELLLNGGFNPLDGFLNKKDTESVYDNYRLANGMLWPMPINLDVATETGKQLASSPQGSVALRDQEGNLIAVMDLNDAWEVDKEREAKAVFGGDPEHPAIRYLYNQAGDMYLGGQLRGYQLPPHYDYTSMRQTPAELRAQFDEMGWTGKPVVAFQTRNPMHRAHVELVKSAAEEHNANILIHPVVGMTKPGGELFMFLHLSIQKYL